MQYIYKRDGTLQTNVRNTNRSLLVLLALRSFSGINNVFCSNYSGNETKSGKFIFDDDVPPYYFPPQRARNMEDPETDTDGEARVSTTTTESDCPVEGGAVFTRWGAVSLGTVLAGLAAGMFQQAVPLPDLVRRIPPDINLPAEVASSTIDNRFAATLVGKDSFQFVD
jgi:hypothetical protein